MRDPSRAWFDGGATGAGAWAQTAFPTHTAQRVQPGAVFDPAQPVSPSWRQHGALGQGSPGRLCPCVSPELWVWLSRSHHLLLFKKAQEALGSASKQDRLTLQACILNQFTSNTKEIPNQRAFYFLCFPCNPPDCLPVPENAAGLEASSLSSHTGELVLSALLDGLQL